ncbi:translation elongation factor Ts [Paracoccus chinensis]|uniref:Elongation factor Ts n=1 Tax=Paracoccus chinensis TaxID=525640 RepID=A0A1G9ENE5_9RHOB|nr:translation elongation factor Ts [Paracoccus chinensis]SDK77650.1 translation elongation factor Ts (EF-Ts) [Paracoccus chinensis]
MAISAAMVKELRESTGAGMMDAKKALEETSGDMEAAVDWLRTKGLAKAAKKSGRIAAEGLVAVAVEGGKGVAVEVNSETDFVAKNEAFQGMVRDIAQVGLTADSTEALAAVQLNGKPVSEVLTDAIAKIGENMTLRRLVTVEGENVVSYVHNAAAPNMGKIGVLVALKGDAAKAQEIGKQIAMHIAATSPASLSEADLDPALVEREKTVLTEQARESGKPEAVIEKMIVGRMSKFFEEVTLLGQKFVINPDVTVAQAAKDAGVEVTAYARVAVGEGIEKKEEDFAAEVAKTLKGA